MLKIGWIELVYAYLLGAPVKVGKDGRTIKRKHLRLFVQEVFEYALWGIDISKWQAFVDWVKVKASNTRFIILRASYGTTVDQRWEYNINKVIEVFVGWLFGVYHYYDPMYSPKQQADVLLKAIAPYRRYISRIWVDLEFTWSGNFSDPKYWYEFCEILRKNGYLIGTYTRKTWWDSRVGGWAWYFAQFPWWVAQYSSALTYIPKGCDTVSIWQNGTFLASEYFAPGTIEGSKEFDHNLGITQAFINAEFRTVVTPEPPPIGENMEVEYECVTSVTVRNAANLLESSRVGTLSVGDKVIVREPEGVVSLPDSPIPIWLEFYTIIRKDGTRASFLSPHYCSGHTKYMKRIDPPVEPDPTPNPGAFTTTLTFSADGTVTGTWTSSQ